ncbi:MAG: hypothetical protein AB9883_07510 [Acidaminococcaceae bacterium]
MKKPSIVINDAVRIMPEPKVKLWRIIAEFREKMKKLSKQLLEEFEKIAIVKDKPESINAYTKLLDQVNEHSDELMTERTKGKMEIIKAAFEIESIEDLPIAAVPILFDEIDAYLTALISGKAEQLPNAETPPAE